MSDFSSSLPVRSENPGDVIVKIADATTPAQQASVDASGRLLARITATNGDSLTDTGGSLNVNITNAIATGVVDETAFTYGTTTETTVGGVYQDTSPTLTSGQQGAVRLTSTRAFHTTNYTAAGVELLGQAAMAGSLPVTIASNQSALSITANTFGTVAAGAAGTQSELAGLVYNSSAPSLTNGQQVALQGDSSGNLRVTLATGANTIGTVNQGNTGSNAQAWWTQIGDTTNGPVAVKAASTAAVATDKALVVTISPNTALPTGANTIGAVSLVTAGSANSITNPIFTTNVDTVGTSVDSYQTSVAVAAAATVNLDYTVTAAKTFYCQQLWATGSGKIKVVLAFETGVATGVFTTVWVGFNSTATPNILIPLPPTKTQIAGAKIRVAITNDDKAAFDVFETLSGVEN